MVDAAGHEPIDFEGEEFKALLERIEGLLIQGTEGGKPDLSGLEVRVKAAIQQYLAEKGAAEIASRANLHHAAEPLESVLAILTNEANQGRIFSALAGSLDRTSIDWGLANQRFGLLVDDLEKILAEAKAAAPRKAKRGKPAQTNYLQLLVGDLDNFWFWATGDWPTQGWHKDSRTRKISPTSLGSELIYEVLKFADEKSLSMAPDVQETIIAERNDGKFIGWFDEECRRAAFSVKSRRKR